MSRQLIMFVGPDRCAKTTIAKALSEKNNFYYYKANDEAQNFLYRQDRFIHLLRYADPARFDLIAQLKDVSIVLDRGFPCEAVYSTYFNRKTDSLMLQKLDQLFSNLNGKIIFCTRKDFINIYDDKNSSMNLKIISSLYESYLQTIKTQVIRLDVDDNNLQRQLSDIEASLFTS